MFTIKVFDHPRTFCKFTTKQDAHQALISLGWTASMITDGYFKNTLKAAVVPYFEPLSLEDLRMLKIEKPLTKDR